jgi:hypothetical protein
MCRVVDAKEQPCQLVIGNPSRVEDDLDCLHASRSARTHLLLCGIVDMPSGIARANRYDTGYTAKCDLQLPTADTCECGSLESRALGPSPLSGLTTWIDAHSYSTVG